MEDNEIRIHCIDFATRGGGVNGFVASQMINHAKVFYNWVTKGDEDTPVPVPAKPKTQKTARKR